VICVRGWLASLSLLSGTCFCTHTLTHTHTLSLSLSLSLSHTHTHTHTHTHARTHPLCAGSGGGEGHVRGHDGQDPSHLLQGVHRPPAEAPGQFVCVRVCACVCVRACVRVRVRLRVWVSLACACACLCLGVLLCIWMGESVWLVCRWDGGWAGWQGRSSECGSAAIPPFAWSFSPTIPSLFSITYTAHRHLPTPQEDLPAGPEDLLAIEDASRRSFFGSRATPKARTGLYAIGQRAAILAQLEAPVRLHACVRACVRVGVRVRV
jgi:hypothetical protein